MSSGQAAEVAKGKFLILLYCSADYTISLGILVQSLIHTFIIQIKLQLCMSMDISIEDEFLCDGDIMGIRPTNTNNNNCAKDNLNNVNNNNKEEVDTQINNQEEECEDFEEHIV